MNIYGMGQGQALGQGTFTFDKIAPNRYLLDRYANEDRILPGRYALVEYSHCIAEVKDWNEDYSLEYDPGSKLYDIIKVKDRVISFEEDAEDKIFIMNLFLFLNLIYKQILLMLILGIMMI